MNIDIAKSLFCLLLFASLQYWQLTQLIKDGEVNKTACFWIAFDTIFIAVAIVKLVIGIIKKAAMM